MRLILPILLFVSLAAHAQPADTAVVDQLYNHSKRFIYSNRDSAIYYLDSAQAIANRINYTRGKAYVLYGYCLNEPVLYKRFQYAAQSYEIFDELNDDFGRGLGLMQIGYVYDLLGDREKSIDYYRRALDVKMKVDDAGGIALALINIGLYNRYKRNHEEALKYFEQSVPYRLKAGTRQGIAYAQLNIGETLFDLNRFDEAQVMADSAVANFNTTQDKSAQTRSLMLKA